MFNVTFPHYTTNPVRQDKEYTVYTGFQVRSYTCLRSIHAIEWNQLIQGRHKLIYVALRLCAIALNWAVCFVPKKSHLSMSVSRSSIYWIFRYIQWTVKSYRIWKEIKNCSWKKNPAQMTVCDCWQYFESRKIILEKLTNSFLMGNFCCQR